MQSLTMPDIDHRDLYEQCVPQTQGEENRAILTALTDRIVAAGVAFSGAAAAQQLFDLDPIALTPAEDSLVRPMYDYRLVQKEGNGRWAYDRIKNAARYCPYCTFGEVYEVDHFLAKTDYREVNICPANLLPICHPCNHIKLASPPEAADRYLLHPYFDNLPNIRWLFADLSFDSGGPVLTFRVLLDAEVYGNLAGRLSYHFEKLQLDRRFQERASKVLVEIESDMADKFETLGAGGMAEHFQSEAERHFLRHGNSLESAGYFAAAANPEYCAGHLIN